MYALYSNKTVNNCIDAEHLRMVYIDKNNNIRRQPGMELTIFEAIRAEFTHNSSECGKSMTFCIIVI